MPFMNRPLASNVSLVVLSLLSIGIFSACAPTPCALDSDCPDTQFCNVDAEQGVCEDGDRPTFNPVGILSLAFDPSPVVAGESSTLSWTTENADACFLKEGEDGTEESVDVDSSKGLSPERTASYTLRCEGEGSDAVETATLVVSRPVTLDTFTASAAAIDEGGSVTLTWTSSNSTDCTLTAAPVPDGTLITAAGYANESVDVTPAEDTAYTLECNGEGGPVSETVNVDVWRILSFDLDDNNEVIAAPADVTFSFSVAGPSVCEVTGEGVTSSDATSAAATAPSGETLYTLTCTGNDGDLIRRATVYGLAIESFTSSATDVATGSDVALSWTAVEADACELTQYGVDTDEAISLAVVTGNEGSYVATLDVEKDFGLLCSRTRGDATATVTSDLLRVTTTN
ncbi:MAG: hypothetical protein GY822_24315 [Deltaproteobacteria bacterium]|nr:hypothetical protein [Deltaproteobacteria bacterium]